MKTILDFINESIDNGLKDIKQNLKDKKPFFVENENIKDVMSAAKEIGYMVVKLYLDKAEPSDMESFSNNGQKVLPQWAGKIVNNDKNCVFLLIDDTGKVNPKVLNAIMPIVIDNEICGKKYDNFVPVVSTTDFSKLPKPMQSKLK